MLFNPKFFDVVQNSDEWYDLRICKITASMSSDLFMDKKTKGYKDCITKIVMEKITGKTQKQFANKWMDYGHETEPEANENYEIETFSTLENGGIWIANEWVAASPDAKIFGLNAGTEFKCPSISTYRDYLDSFDIKGKVEVPKDYYIQIQHQLLCTGWDYIDYMPYYSSKLKQLLTRVEIDLKLRSELIERIEEAVNEIEILIPKYTR
jgi:hypothetical protein